MRTKFKYSVKGIDKPLEVARLRLQGMSFGKIAETLGEYVRASYQKYLFLCTAMERSVGLIVHAHRLSKRKLNHKQRKLLQKAETECAKRVKYGDLDAFHWLRRLYRSILKERTSGRVMHPLEEKMLACAYRNEGFTPTDFARKYGLNVKTAQKTYLLLRHKLRAAVGNFVRLDSVIPEPHERVSNLWRLAAQIRDLAEYPPEIDPLNLAGEALLGVWAQELVLRRMHEKAAVFRWLSRKDSLPPPQTKLFTRVRLSEYLIEIIRERLRHRET